MQTMLLGLGLDLSQVHEFATLLQTRGRSFSRQLRVAPPYTVKQHPPAHREGWMVSGQETVFCWVPVPYLTMVVTSVAFFLTT